MKTPYATSDAIQHQLAEQVGKETVQKMQAAHLSIDAMRAQLATARTKIPANPDAERRQWLTWVANAADTAITALAD